MPGQLFIALTTALEQNFKNVMEAFKAAFIKWYPTYQSYQNAGGPASLQQCMNPIVQNAFTFRLRNLKRTQFFFCLIVYRFIYRDSETMSPLFYC
jgi:hypothetical protein